MICADCLRDGYAVDLYAADCPHRPWPHRTTATASAPAIPSHTKTPQHTPPMSTDPTYTDDDWARHFHSLRLRLMSSFLGGAIRWRDESMRVSDPRLRYTCRRWMRQDARAWVRHWRGL